jgi:hypothetical protein
MSTEVLERRFARIGARLKVEERPWTGEPRIDVRHDRQGEYFELRFEDGEREVDVEVVDARRDDRHLLLLIRDGDEKSKFLCGHDEPHWFVAAIPEDARGVSGVTAAMLALHPPHGLSQAEFDSGAVRHPDQATTVLRGWHRVAMNTEQNARAMRHVAFLDRRRAPSMARCPPYSGIV